MKSRTRNGTLAKSLIAGAVGGLAASYAMNQFQSLLTAVTKELSKREGDQQSSGGEDATVKAAEVISEHVFHHELTGAEKKWAGSAVHYAFGTLIGAVYGVLAETVPAARSGHGAAFGTAVWLAADEIGVPALGLAQPPSQTPASSHVKALASHLVYGFTTDLTTRTIQRATAHQ
jgi:putative membrane protein